MPLLISAVLRRYFNKALNQISSQLIKWGIFIVQWVVRSLNSLDAKIHQRPSSVDLYILQEMLILVGNFPCFQLPGDLQSEVQERSKVFHFSSKSITKKKQYYLRQVISLPVEGTLRLVRRVLRSLQRLDKKLHHRTPQILTVLKRTLSTADSIERMVEELKSVDESGVS